MGKISDAIEKAQQSPIDRLYDPNQAQLKSVEDPSAKTAANPFPMSLNSLNGHLDHNLIAYFKPESIEAEQFRKLAANVLFHSTENATRCLLVTSANEGEGKSFLTANLAVSLAKSLEEPVLLVDCDLRRPRQHTMFGFGTVSGLSDHFIKDMDISALIQKTSIENLSLLAGWKQIVSFC